MKTIITIQHTQSIQHTNLICYGRLDSGYLWFRCNYQFFNVDDTIIIRYNFIDKDEDDCLAWSAGKGEHILKYHEFVSEIEDLLNCFFAAMDKQVERAMHAFSEKELKKSNLLSEHMQRKDYFYSVLNSMKNNSYQNQIDWQKLRQDLEEWKIRYSKWRK